MKPTDDLASTRSYDPSAKQKAADKTSRIPIKIVPADRC